MTVPTDADTTRQFRVAARLMAAIAAGFFAIGGVAIGVAMPDEMLTSRPAPFQPAAPEPSARTAATTSPAAAATAGHQGHETPPVAVEDPNAPLVVKVKMGEFFFAPNRITAPAGRLIRFEVSNPGVVPHEFLIGDRHTQDDAEREMATGAKSGKGHTHANSASVYLNAGESGVLEATFDTPGELIIGCHVPGHWSAGMKGTFTVTPS